MGRKTFKGWRWRAALPLTAACALGLGASAYAVDFELTDEITGSVIISCRPAPRCAWPTETPGITATTTAVA